MINTGVGKTSDPKNLPQRILNAQLIQHFQIVMQLAGVIHNHPSGDPTPSRADIDMTKQVIEAARALSVQVHDHLIVGREGVASFKQLGLM